LRNDFEDASEVIKKSLTERKNHEIEDSDEKPVVDYMKQIEQSPEEVFEQEFDESAIIEVETESTPANKKETPKKTEIYGDLRPTRCHLCIPNLEFEEDQMRIRQHFEAEHGEIKLTKCQKCEFETEFPWFMNLHYHVSIKKPDNFPSLVNFKMAKLSTEKNLYWCTEFLANDNSGIKL
jgi:hypothetical protein